MIDTNSIVWHQIKQSIERRINELREVCCSTGASDEQRLTSAHRIDELRLLLDEPETMLARAQQTRMSHDKVY